mgnify:CR=1 FL=1
MSELLQAKLLEIDDPSYRRLRSLNASTLKVFIKDPCAYYRQFVAQDVPRQATTKQMEFGTMLHKILETGGRWQDHVVEEPEGLPSISAEILAEAEKYIDVPDHVLINNARRGKKYLEWKGSVEKDGRLPSPKGYTSQECLDRKKFDKDCKGKFLIKAGQFNSLRVMTENLMKNKFVRYLVNLESSRHEQTILWRHPESRILCKSRLDVVAPECIVDWKTTATVNRKKLTDSIFTFGYDLSAAFYTQAVEQLLGGERLEFYWVFIEKTGGFNFEVVSAAPWIETAMQVIDKKMIELKTYDFSRLDAKEVVELTPPPWVDRFYQEILNEQAY